jgi:hypothetical protein
MPVSKFGGAIVGNRHVDPLVSHGLPSSGELAHGAFGDIVNLMAGGEAMRDLFSVARLQPAVAVAAPIVHEGGGLSGRRATGCPGRLQSMPAGSNVRPGRPTLSYASPPRHGLITLAPQSGRHEASAEANNFATTARHASATHL